MSWQQQHPPQAHIVCGGCQCLLLYPYGASQVRCYSCQHVTNAPPGNHHHNPGQGLSHVACSGCHILLQYPRGSGSVQCSVCRAYTTIPAYSQIACGGCTVLLMYPTGAASVRCSLCNTVTAASRGGSTSHGRTAAPPGPVVPPKVPKEMVVIENPTTLDVHGNEVASIAVGIKCND